MTEKKTVPESHLAALAKAYRQESGKSRAQAAREMGVTQTTIFNAEEKPELSLTRIRICMIEAYSCHRVRGPMYVLEEKSD